MRARRFLIVTLYISLTTTENILQAQHRTDSVATDSNGSRIGTIEINSKSNARFDSKGMGIKEILGEEEFKKAACCTLSESFELTNTVEVSNSDGVSGMKQIELNQPRN